MNDVEYIDPPNGERCETCRFSTGGIGRNVYLRCARNAPKISGEMEALKVSLTHLLWHSGIMAGIDDAGMKKLPSHEEQKFEPTAIWPVVDIEDWCGQWESRP